MEEKKLQIEIQKKLLLPITNIQIDPAGYLGKGRAIDVMYKGEKLGRITCINLDLIDFYDFHGIDWTKAYRRDQKEIDLLVMSRFPETSMIIPTTERRLLIYDINNQMISTLKCTFDTLWKVDVD